MDDAHGSLESQTATSQPSPTHLETRLSSRTERAMELYLEQLEAGESPDRASFLAKYSDIAGELAGHLEALEFLHFTAPQLTHVKDAATDQELSGQATLGDFRLIKPIGRGGMGIVYEAEQLSLGRRVAVKVLPFASMLDPRQLKRFQNEARSAATLEHPHIVPIHFVGQERGVHFYAMQLIEGQSLAEVLREMRAPPNSVEQHRYGSPGATSSTNDPQWTSDAEGCEPETGSNAAGREAAGKHVGQGGLSHPSNLQNSTSRREFYRTVAMLGAQAAEALQHAHEQGIIHRDIKPGNLMVDWSGKLWITDFGLARLDTNESITAAGDLLGTLAYMSPEQLAGNAIADSRSDIYSLGATLYELLTRERPFHRRSEASRLPAALPSEAPPLSRFDRNIPLDLQTIVLKAMSGDPAGRYLTAQTMAEDLRCFAAGAAIRARPPSRSERAIRWAQRHPQMLASLGLATVILIGGLVLSTVQVWRANLKSQELLSTVRRHADKVEDMLYLSDVQLAYQAWETQKLGSVRSILQQQVPADEDEKDRRGVEWHLLNVLSDTPQHKLIGQHVGAANQLALFPDRKRVASVGDDRQLRIWNLETGEALATISMGTSSAEALCSVAVSPDGETVATGSDVVQLWDVKSQKLIRKLTSFDYNVQSIAFSPSRPQIAVGSRYDRIRLLDLAGNVLAEIEDESRHESLAFTPDGQELLIPSRRKLPHITLGFVNVWRSDLSVVRAQLPGDSAASGPNYTLANVSPDGTFFVLGSRDGKQPIHIVDARSKELLISLPGKHDQVNALDISPDGKILAVAFNDGTIEYSQLERTEAGQFLSPEKSFTLNAHAGKVNSIKFASPTELVSCGADGQVKSWQLNDEKLRRLGRSETYALDISLGNGEIVSADNRGLNLLNPADGRIECQVDHYYATEADIEFSRDGRFVAGTSGSDRVFVYRRADLEILQVLVFAARPTGLSFSPVKGELAVITANGILKTWDLETMSPIAELDLNPTSTGSHSTCTYTVDGKFILAAGASGKMVVVDASTFRRVRDIPLASNTNAIACSPGGDILATAHDDGGIRIWDWPRGEIRTTLIGHTQKVRRLAFSPNGLTLASCSLDDTTRLWAPKSGRYYGILHHHAANPTDLAFSPDGAFLAVTQDRPHSTEGGILIFPTAVDPSQ